MRMFPEHADGPQPAQSVGQEEANEALWVNNRKTAVILITKNK
jgi:hypothetical protein